MPDQPTYRSQVLDHLGLVAGMFDERGIGDVIDQATHPNPAMRDLTVGEAVKAMVRNGLGFVNHALSLVPRFFHNTPTSRRIAPRVSPAQLHDDALGRALETLSPYGVTELYSLMTATAVKRLELCPAYAPLDTTSLHVDGRQNSDDAPSEHVVHITQGSRRDHRPDLNQVVLEVIVEHQAGIPMLMKPLRGHRHDAQEFGQVIRAPIDQWHTTYGATYLVADSALQSAANLAKLAQTELQWIPRVPATVSEAQAVLVQADPQTMTPLQAGYRAQEVTSAYGGVAQRWSIISSEPRQPQAQRPVDKQRRTQSDQEGKALQQLCRTPLACEADARQALATFAQDVQATFLATSTVRAMPRQGKRGRPGPGVQPAQVVYQIAGACASSLAARQARVDQHSCFLLATNARNDTQLPPHELLEGDNGQGHAARGLRFLQDPQFFASSLSLTKPERIMALLMVMTGCLLGYAA